ncbi:XkdX family protein [Limosilactobacillus ingluviei]|uniref:XkdX family protein n=1 Tax=Limosilactobacillus TaxID=2742598 RepID=UPI0009EAB9A6|nr:XkdX family protein [Limosilactobacillus ingluviei]
MLDLFKLWFELKLFTVQDERNAVLTGLITQDDFKTITGLDYSQSATQAAQPVS